MQSIIKHEKKILLILYILLFTMGYIYDFNNPIINDFIGLFMAYIIQRFFLPYYSVFGRIAALAVAYLCIKDLINIFF